MGRLVRTCLAAGTLAPALVFAAFGFALANHEPETKCSSSGDTCAGTLENQRGVHILEINSFGLRGRIEVCSRRVGGEQKCIDRRMKHVTGDIYGSRVKWEPNFPSRRGRYVITWREHDDRVGPRLGLHER